jgi:hypothetical protein
MWEDHPWFCCLFVCLLASHIASTPFHYWVFTKPAEEFFESLARRYWNIRVSLDVGFATGHMHIGLLNGWNKQVKASAVDLRTLHSL